MEVFDYYLIAVNVLGFILYGVNTWLYCNTAEGQVDKLLTIIALLGGSLGIIIFVVAFDRKAAKGNMMSRVFVACVFVIQLVIVLALHGVHGEKIIFEFWEFFEENRIFLIYLGVISFATFIAFGVDKIAALKGWTRIRNVTLLGLCFIGGSLGGLAAMYLFHHKTNKEKNDFYTVGVPMMIIMQVVVIFYWMNLP